MTNGLINRIVQSAHGLVIQRQQVAGHEVVRMAAKQMPLLGKKITLPRKSFFFPHFRRTTPWGGFLHMRSSFPDLLQTLCVSKPPMIVIDTDYVAFGGSPFDTGAIRAAWNGALLVRDFVLSAYQLDEAKACGADGIIFPSWAWCKEGTPKLIEACHELGMPAFCQVCNINDLEKIHYFTHGRPVFVSWIDIGKQIRKNTMQEMKEMVDAIGKSKCIVVDGPWNPAQSMEVLSTLHCRGIAYPDGLLGGDSACERIDAFRSGKTDVASVNEQIDTNPHDEIEQQVDEPWVIVINQQFAQPFFMPYTSEAEAVRACSTLRKAWSEFKSKQTSKGEKPHGVQCIVEMPRGMHGATYAIDVETIASIVCLPGHCVAMQKTKDLG